MAISIRGLGISSIVPSSRDGAFPCVGPHTVVLEPEDLTPGARIDCVLCGEFVATIEQPDLREKR